MKSSDPDSHKYCLIITASADQCRPVAVLLLADSIYQEGVEGCRARGRANLPSLLVTFMVHGKTFYTIWYVWLFFPIPFILSLYVIYFIFPKDWKCALTFFLQKETPQVWLDEIWVDNWHALNWMKGESFSQAASFLLRLISPLFSILCCVKNKWNVKR